MPGVIRTRVGYTGGTREDPTYKKLGDHTEAVQVDYDPTQISYAELLDAFWQGHSPRSLNTSRQYMNAIFYHTTEQQQWAIASRDQLAAERGWTITTKILPLTTFYLAEDYHQKWALKNRLVYYDDLRAIYPQPEDLTNSTAAARLNGYLDGFGTSEQLETEIDSLGLSPTARLELLRRFDLAD
jgi:methionine-S-sulfoxide reductase